MGLRSTKENRVIVGSTNQFQVGDRVKFIGIPGYLMNTGDRFKVVGVSEASILLEFVCRKITGPVMADPKDFSLIMRRIK